MSIDVPSDPYKDRAMEVLRALADLFDDVPHVMFCAKDESGSGRSSRSLQRPLKVPLTRQFRRVVGVSPGAYRSQVLGR